MNQIISFITTFINNKIVLNFWNSLFLLVTIRLVCTLLGVIVVLTFSELPLREFYHTDSGYLFIQYFSILSFVPFIFWISKKTSTNVKDLYVVPEFLTVLKVLGVLVLVKFVVLTPLEHMDLFFGPLMDSRLRILDISFRPILPLLDLHMIIIVPIVEELFFRGLVLKNFLKKYSPLYAILLSCLLFGIAHLNLDTLIYHIALGMLFGILYYKTNSLIISTLAHMIWNACTFFNYAYVDLNTTNTINYLFIYATAVGLLVILLKSNLTNGNRSASPNKIEI